MKRPEIFGLIGFPLGHSFSKNFFTEEFHKKNINAQYLNFEIDDIGKIMEVVSEYPELRGLNVTTPYKRQVLPYIDILSPDAEAIGAVNVIKIKGDGSDMVFEGHNTDARGFAIDIASKLPASDSKPIKALVLGSGGASSAVIYGLESIGVKATVVSRTPQGKNAMSYSGLTPAIIADNHIVVNATPLGMAPHENEAPPFPYQWLSSNHLCYDLIYNPSPTKFMKLCSRHGATVSDGIGMLIAQARLSWLIWKSEEL